MLLINQRVAIILELDVHFDIIQEVFEDFELLFDGFSLELFVQASLSFDELADKKLVEAIEDLIDGWQGDACLITLDLAGPCLAKLDLGFKAVLLLTLLRQLQSKELKPLIFGSLVRPHTTEPIVELGLLHKPRLTLLVHDGVVVKIDFGLNEG